MRFVVQLSLAVFVLSIIGVIALNNLFAVDTTSWDAQSILIWASIPAMMLVGVIIWIINKAITDNA